MPPAPRAPRSPRAPRNQGPPRAPRGNSVSEWFAHRVYPTVASNPEALADQRANRCPMLSQATGTSTECVKAPASKGICTISSASSGVRHDWLVCPFRALDAGLLDTVARRLYGFPAHHPLLIIPAPTLDRPADRERVKTALANGVSVILYLQNKLGGEISIPSTERSPELSFDMTTVQLLNQDGALRLGKYGIFELQTVDFHGSYRAVSTDLKDALRLHGDDFHAALAKNQDWLSKQVESPNISNVFKRTFYQMVFKFQIGADETCAGCAIAIPLGVWQSWKKHLGNAPLTPGENGVQELRLNDMAPKTPAWIYVFEIDTASPQTPNPIRIVETIATDAEAIVHYALRVAPEAAVSGVGSADRVLASIRRRIIQWWPELREA
jgi:hypothetical protein